MAIVPAYLARETLCSTLASLAAQRGIDRVVVVASPGDDGAARARAFAGVEVVAAPERWSAGRARNEGRAAAPDADLLLFIDADVRLAPGAVEALVEAVSSGRADAVGPSIVAEPGGAIAWLRHLLEFKDAERGRSTGCELLPTAALLCRASDFDRAGGFADMWPGEDLVFCHRLRGLGLRLERLEDVVAHHRHPRGVRAMLDHQYRLGATSALARLATDMRGVAFARRPALAAAMVPARTLRALLWLARFKPHQLPIFAALLPLYLVALGTWTLGFAGAARSAQRVAA